MLKRYGKVVFITLLILGSFWLGNFTKEYLANIRQLGTALALPTLIAKDTLNANSSKVAAPLKAAVLLPPVGPAKVVAVTQSNITLQVTFTTTKTYTFTPSTDFYSTAFEGKRGRIKSDIKVGSLMTLYPANDDVTNARSMIFMRDPSLTLSPEDISSYVIGKITSLSTSEATITPTDGSSPVVIALNPALKVITSVKNDEVGRSLAIGELVLASGLTNTNGVVTAKLMVIAPQTTQ